MKRQGDPLHAALVQGVEQTLRKMQPRRGRGHGPGLLGVDGLVVGGIGLLSAGIALDVGRQRHLAVRLEGLQQRPTRQRKP